MKAKFVIGRAGAGKTSFCLNEISQNIDGKTPLLLLVPNQFSLEMEKDLVKKTGGKGMDMAQVLSFERLSYRVFSLYGKPDKRTLDETGKAALLRKIMYENRERLNYYGGAYGKEGFITQLCSLLTEFNKYGISSEKLEKTSEKAGFANTLLSSKLSDLSFVMSEFSDFIKDEYITLEQNLDLLAEVLPNALYFHGLKIWIDGFYRFTQQDYVVIERLCEICGEITVSLTMPEATDFASAIDTYDPFYETKTAAKSLAEIFRGCGAGDIETVRLTKKDEFGYSVPLTEFERQYFHFSPMRVTVENGSAFITENGNIYEEVDLVASEVASLVREQGLRYKEIAVCACDLELYGHVLRDSFKKYGVPYFIDMSRTIYTKRLVETIRSVIETCAANWSGDSVVRLLRTGLLGFSENETDILENYILEFEVKGYKWKREWKSGVKSGRYNLEALNALRQRILDACKPFHKVFINNKKPTVKQAAEAIFNFIEKNGVREKLLQSEENKKEIAQIWNIVVSVFDKLVEILADENVDIRTFSQIVEGAFEGVTEGFIPQTADAVIIGDIKRTRLPSIKTLFVLGLNEGVIPSSKGADGILSDADRALLAENGAALAPYGVRQAICEQFLVYCAMSKPKERLYLSWPATGFDGQALRKSVIVEKAEAIFPKACKIKRDERGNTIFNSKKAFLSEIAVKTGALRDGGTLNGIWADGLKWLQKTEYIRIISDGAYASRRAERLSEKSVNNFLKKDIYSSITRIEKYIKCPFSYFAEYGLKAYDRHVYGVKPMDMGNIYHCALEELGRKMAEKGLKWGSLGEADAAPIIDESVEAACSELDLFDSSEKNRYLISRIKRIANRAVWALDYHVNCGSFTPYDYETGFGTESGLLPPVIIELDGGYRFVFNGRIDRVDVYDTEGARYVKIIDYKSGGKKFDLAEVYYGLQLQLILYMDAYLKGNGNAIPAGIFYFRVADPLIDYSTNAGGDPIDGVLSQLKLSGLAVNDLDIIDALHNGLGGASNIIPVKLKKPAKKDALPEPDTYSSVATAEQFYMLMKRAEDVIAEAGNRLIAGDIEPKPVKGVGDNPCRFCGYGSICGFDVSAGYRQRNLKRIGKNDVLELLEGKSEL